MLVLFQASLFAHTDRSSHMGLTERKHNLCKQFAKDTMQTYKQESEEGLATKNKKQADRRTDSQSPIFALSIAL